MKAIEVRAGASLQCHWYTNKYSTTNWVISSNGTDNDVVASCIAHDNHLGTVLALNCDKLVRYGRQTWLKWYCRFGSETVQAQFWYLDRVGRTKTSYGRKRQNIISLLTTSEKRCEPIWFLLAFTKYHIPNKQFSTEVNDRWRYKSTYTTDTSIRLVFG